MNTSLPSFDTYGKYKTMNYGTNALKFWMGHITVWFSYRTPVAFQANGFDLVIRENEWGTTSSKHLNAIDPDKSKRIPGEQFLTKLNEAISC